MADDTTANSAAPAIGPAIGPATEPALARAIEVSDRLLAIPTPKHADLSPDGTSALITVGVVAVDSDDDVFELVQISTLDGSSTVVPGTVPGDRYGVWSPDGSRVAWLTERTGTTQVAVADAHAHAHVRAEPEIVTDLPAGASSPVAWSPDGMTLVISAPARRAQIDRTRPYRITRPTARFDGIGWLDEAPQLWLVDLRPSLHTGVDPSARQRLLTDDGWRWSAASWSADGNTLLAVANHAPHAVGRASEVRVVQLDGSWRVADVPRSENAHACWSASGQVVAVPARIAGEGTGRKKDIWVERPGAPAECRTRGFRLGVGGTLYGDHAAWLSEVDWMAPIAGSTDLLVRFGDGGRHSIARVAMEGPEAVTVVAAGDRSLNPVAAAGDVALVVTETAASPCELAVLQISTGALRTITAFSSDAVPSARVQRFTVNATDGPRVEAWYVCAQPVTTPLPTVVIVHGGPEAAFGEAFSIDVHVLCAAGFGVLYCNPRGSTGYGTEFTTAAIGEWGNAPVDDVMAAVDHVVQVGLADPARLGVCGASFGGWMASWLACTSDRFAAAVAENGVTDLLSMSYTSDIGPEFMALSMGGDVQSSLDRYLRWSPLLQAHRCRTPTMFVVGVEDDRVPMSQSVELAAALHRRGIATEIVVLPGCSHAGASSGPVPGRRAQNAAMVEWLLRWLGE